jgi:hypothetical protein
MFRLQLVSVSAAKSEPPTPRSRAVARTAQEREQARVARKRERATRHRERRERRREEYRLREQQGLSSPGTEEYSSSDEEEEEVRGQALFDRWEPAPPVGVLDRQTYQGGTRVSRLCGEDRDRETENLKVCARTRDTRFIQVRVAKVANPTSCLGDQVWRPALGVGLFPEGLSMSS